MANIIPNARKPYYSIQQLISQAKQNHRKTSADIEIPSYISDRRVLAGILYANLPYLKGLASLEPSYPSRYYYSEITTCADPVIQKIYVSPWLGFALLYKKITVIDMLLTTGLDIYQKFIVIDYRRLSPATLGPRKIIITEGPCLLEVSSVLEGPNYVADFPILIHTFESKQINLERPLEVRNQTLSETGVESNDAICYRDLWEYLEFRLNKLPPILKDERIKIMKLTRDGKIEIPSKKPKKGGAPAAHPQAAEPPKENPDETQNPPKLEEVGLKESAEASGLVD